jgi:uncharacterized membrane protein YbhN (UPF0104 family)
VPFSRPTSALLLSVLIAAGTVVAIASSDSVDAIIDAIGRFDFPWFGWAILAELTAYVGYVAAYRSRAHAPDHPDISLRMSIRLVVAGFGPFLALGGFAFDRRVHEALGGNERTARIAVLGLGVVEYALLAPAAWICALILFFGHDRASAALTLPWIIAVPSGAALAFWLSRPSAQRRFARSRGRFGRAWSEILGGLLAMRRLLARPHAYPGALLGMAVYWAADIACLGFALRCFGIELGVPGLVVAHATGYAASRRSLPFGGAGITEALMTLALIWVHVPAAAALVGVVAYRLINFVAPALPALIAHAELHPLLNPERHGSEPA